MRNLRYPFGRDVGAQAASRIETRSKRGRLKEILARRESSLRMLALVAIAGAIATGAALLG